MQKQISDYFKNYPTSNQCFQTADGLIFHQDGDAMLHAKSLKNKEVKRHVAPDSEIEESVIATSEADKLGKFVTKVGETDGSAKVETMTVADSQDSDLTKTKLLVTPAPELEVKEKEVGKEAPQIVDKTGDKKADSKADDKVVDKKAGSKAKSKK